MKLQHNINIIFLAINVACCYPSPGEHESNPEILFSPSENISPSVYMPLSYLDGSTVAKDNNFPEVEYPNKILDTIEPFYYRAADHDDTLAPFTSDVKESFKSLEAERRVKEYSARQDSISSKDNNQPTLEDCDDAQINDLLSYNVANTSDVNVCDGYSQAASEEDGEKSDGTNCQLNLDNENIELTGIATSSTEMSVTTQEDSSEHSDNNENMEPTSTLTDSTETSVTIQENASEHSDDNENIETTSIPTETTETSVTTQEDSSEHSDDNGNIEPTSIPTEATETSVTTQEDSSEHSDDNGNIEPTSIPTEATETSVTTQEDSSEHSDDNGNIEPTSIPTEATETSVTSQEDSSEHSGETVYLDKN